MFFLIIDNFFKFSMVFFLFVENILNGYKNFVSIRDVNFFLYWYFFLGWGS